MQRIFKTSGKIFPSTVENISIWAETSVGEKVDREENIDLGRFTGKIEKLHLRPPNPTAPKEAIQAITAADLIIVGPGDLYTTILPTLLVPDILSALKKAKAKKIFVVNVANKVFETPDYKVADFIQAIIKHCESTIFEYFMVNNNIQPKIPTKFKRQYDYVGTTTPKDTTAYYNIIKKDLVDEDFPLYHSSKKLAKAVFEAI